MLPTPRGSTKKFFLVRLPVERSPQGLERVFSTIDKHFAWIKRNHEEGRLLISGPAADYSCGMLLFRAPDRAALDAMLAEEPAVASGAIVPDVTEWDIHQFMSFGPFGAEDVSKLWPEPVQAAFQKRRTRGA